MICVLVWWSIELTFGCSWSVEYRIGCLSPEWFLLPGPGTLLTWTHVIPFHSPWTKLWISGSASPSWHTVIWNCPQSNSACMSSEQLSNTNYSDLWLCVFVCVCVCVWCVPMEVSLISIISAMQRSCILWKIYLFWNRRTLKITNLPHYET